MKTNCNQLRQVALFAAAFGIPQIHAELGMQNPLVKKCARYAQAITGLNYHRSAINAIASGQIWRFGSNSILRVFDASGAGIAPNAIPQTTQWRLEAEDDRCVFKIASIGNPEHIKTFRITDATWAILKIHGKERHVPDFEDHSGMKTRYCGTGERCEKLWK